ncbi:hypothetical protein ACTHGU_10970 [Chitinophagaceae bacterium MMS25-I14]
MKKLTCLIVLFFLSTPLFAQPKGWVTPANIGLPVNYPYWVRHDDVYFCDKDTGVIVAASGQILKTYDGGIIWLEKANYPGHYFRSLEFSDNFRCGIAGSLEGLICRTSDRGETWTDISANISDTGVFYKRICGLAHWGNNVFYGVGWWGGNVARFYKSTDTGKTWITSYIDTNLASGLVDITCLSADTIFATGCRLYQNGTKRESVVLRSVNAGQTWTKVFSDTTFGGRIWKIQFVDRLFAVGSIEPMYADTAAMIKTTDGGNTWNMVSIAHQDSYAWGTQGIGFLNHYKGWIGGYYTGLWETDDGGLSWQQVSPLECDQVNRFFKIDDTTMYASGKYLYRYSDSMEPTGMQNHAATTPQNYLLPVVPNPASGIVHINIALEHTSNIVLEVVDLGGRMVYRIANGYLQAGKYSYTWDGTKMPRGNYIVWLGTDIAPMVQKFTLY